MFSAKISIFFNFLQSGLLVLTTFSMNHPNEETVKRKIERTRQKEED
jgi:hypothetical protein